METNQTTYDTLCMGTGQMCDTVEIREKSTGIRGIADLCPYGVAVYCGNPDGSDDKCISAEAFNRDFEVTAFIFENGEWTFRIDICQALVIIITYGKPIQPL